MQFNDTTNLNGLIQECERLTLKGTGGISNISNTLKDFTSRINQALDRFYAIVFKYDALWNFDDRNHSDLPIASTNIVSGQQDYQFASELLAVTQVFAKDANGVFRELAEQNDITDPESYTIDESNGTPTRYELVGNSILLAPKPNYNSTLGLKVTFKRNGVKFDNDDTTDSPGIPSIFHPYLARYASLLYLLEKGMSNATGIQSLVLQDEAQIREFVSSRAKPKRIGLRITNENNK